MVYEENGEEEGVMVPADIVSCVGSEIAEEAASNGVGMDIAIAVSAATRAVVSSSAEVMVPDYGSRCRPPTEAGVWTLCLEGGGSDDYGGARRGIGRVMVESGSR